MTTRTKILNTFFLMTLVLAGSASARELSPRARVQRFFEALTKQGSDKAIDVLFEGSSLAKAKAHEIEHLKEDVKERLANDKAIGFERVREQTYGRSVKKLVYIYKAEGRPLVWNFYFYRPKSTWTVLSVGLEENLTRLQ